MTGRFAKLGKLIDDYYPVTIQSISTLGGMFSAAAIGDEFSNALGLDEYRTTVERCGIGGLIASCGLFAYSVVLNERQKKRAGLLESEIAGTKLANDELLERLALYETNIENLVDGYLYHFATQRLRFGEGEGNTDRITLYLHDEDKKCFYRLGRYSGNPIYRNSKKHPYEPHRGCIYAAWTDDWFFDASFPDPRNKKEYCRKQKKFRITKNMVNAFAMRPRMYCGCSVKNEGGTNNIAVIVIESVLDDKFTEIELREALQTDAAFHTELAVRASMRYADPDYVRSKGF